MNKIRFGTDGWRALIDKDFTPNNIQKVIQAFCAWRHRVDPQNKKVIVGFDRRSRSPESAQLVAEVLAGNGFIVQLSSQFCPTPCISWMVKNSDAFAGIVVTASHNPSDWNGIKFKESYGGSAAPEYTAQIEAQLEINNQEGLIPKLQPLAQALKEERITYFDPHQNYLGQLKNLVAIDQIKKAGFKVLVDPLFGAGSGFIPALLGPMACELHNEADPHFGGLNPEPIDKNLKDLMKGVVKGGYQVGLATDGDADRIGAVDEFGTFVNSHQIFALLLQHYIEDRGLKGPIVKSLSTTCMIDALCRLYGLELKETPIGFKHICKEILSLNALMGGEESGGISFAPHVHERDGLLNGLMLLEMMAVRKKTLGELLKELHQKIGPFYFARHDLHLDQETIQKLWARVNQNTPPEVAGIAVASVNRVDGCKIILKDQSWLLIRGSGTEPLIRLYAEASSSAQVQALLAQAQKICGLS